MRSCTFAILSYLLTVFPVSAQEAIQPDSVDDLCRQLLQLKFDAILEADGNTDPDARAGHGNDWDELTKEARRVADLFPIILASFRTQIGKQVTVELKTGVQRVRIESITETQIKAAKEIAIDGRVVGTSSVSFEPLDLTPGEMFRQLGQGESPSHDIMRGILAYQAEAGAKAVEFFDRAATPLSARLKDTMLRVVSDADQTRKAQRNAAAEGNALQLYRSILKTAGLPLEGQSEELVPLIWKTKFDKLQAIKCNSAVKEFGKKYGNTKTARDNAKVLSALERIIPNIPLYFDRDTLAKVVGRLGKDNPQEIIKRQFEVKEKKLTLNLKSLSNLRDISALAGLPISELFLDGTGVRDLTPLQGMPLQVLSLRGCKVESLAPLHGLPLTSLDVSGNIKISDLEPLKGMPLKLFRASMHQCREMGRIKDISPLSSMPLVDLDLEDCGPITSLSPLKGLKLKHLRVGGWYSRLSTQILDLLPLVGMPLERLSLAYTKVTDLSPLQVMPLTNLDLAGCPVSDLSPLKKLPLVHLIIRDTKVEDLSPIKGIKTLTKLSRGN